jgi:hypothetical protein
LNKGELHLLCVDLELANLLFKFKALHRGCRRKTSEFRLKLLGLRRDGDGVGVLEVHSSVSLLAVQGKYFPSPEAPNHVQSLSGRHNPKKELT